MATPDADIYSLFLGGQDAGAQAQAQAEALRRRREAAAMARSAGNAALLTGDRVLSNFGQAQLQQAAQGEGEVGRGEGLLAQAGSQLAGRQLQQALAQRQQAFQAEENEQNRILRERGFGESAAARREDRLARQQAREDAAAERLERETHKREDAQAKAHREGVEKLSKALPDDASAFYTDVAEIESLTSEDGVPGVGPLEGRLPDFLTGEQGLKVRQAAGRIGAAYRKLISGAGVSESEKKELNRVTGLLESGKEVQFKEGLKGMKKLYEAGLRQKFAGFPREVVSTYLENSQVLGGVIPAAEYRARVVPPGKVRMTSPDGVTGLVPESEVAEAEKNKWRRAP